MGIKKSYVTDESGMIKNVVIDINTFRKIEDLILDQGLAKAMDEVQDDVEYDIEEAKILLKRHKA
ncbi:MAG: antitoxin [Thermodesulfobacteriota bacterium]|nr:antitoxin [Thermodesulfobacteriota bacterium]